MKEILKRFWYNLLQKINNQINGWINEGNERKKAVCADDDSVVNFFTMVLKKLLNRVFVQCKFEVITESTQAEPLIELCEDLQNNIYKIGAYMLGGSDTPQSISECWAVPYFATVGGKSKLFHSYVDGTRICITGMTGERISDCYIILDTVERNNKTFLLCRRHTLDEYGNLTISFFVGDETANTVNAEIEEWKSIMTDDIVYKGANNIGFGRYKSPVCVFGNDVYGKPINYGCAVIERKIQDGLDDIRHEFKSGRRKLFADESIVKRKKNNKHGDEVENDEYVIDEHIYATRHVPGVTQNLIEDFSPAYRESAHYKHLTKLLEQYQNLIGVNELITHERTSNGATATEVKMLNIDNMSTEENIRQAIKIGNIETLKADSMYLGIREELWSYDETWTDIYVDEQQRLNNMITVYNNGGAEQLDVIKYWNSTLTDEQAQEKQARINAEKKNNTSSAIESMLNM